MFLLENTLVILLEVWTHFRKVPDLFRDIPKLAFVYSKGTTLHIRLNSVFHGQECIMCC